ncbi:Unknown protein [Striga hermonthica]|uniref:Uncharacterized protein n=1 Tax=Striga hermonthica TaxID=68872 RepID=A0A9N7MLF4_STRHE|nr:Unknown protein [Striga hermonthica]
MSGLPKVGNVRESWFPLLLYQPHFLSLRQVQLLALAANLLAAPQPLSCHLPQPPVESITSLRSDPSSMGHVESRVNQQGPPCMAKYSWVTDSEVVP